MKIVAYYPLDEKKEKKERKEIELTSIDINISFSGINIDNKDNSINNIINGLKIKDLEFYSCSIQDLRNLICSIQNRMDIIILRNLLNIIQQKTEDINLEKYLENKKGV